MATIKFKDPNTGNFITVQSISGKSAYQSAREAGFTGSEAEFMQSLANAASVGQKLDKSGGSMDNTDIVTNMNADLLDGKHGSEYAGSQHQHGNITTDGRVGTTSDLLLGTGTGGQIVTKTPKEVATLVGVSNPNILHNWDFRNPVNQRGVLTASGGGYWLDRWTLSGDIPTATYTYSPSWGLRAITTTDYILMRQLIENPNAYAGETVTLSVDVYSASLTASCTMRLWYNGTTQIGAINIANGDTGIKSITATIPNTGLTDLSVAFYNYAGNDVRIKSVKLERGTVSTLHLDPPMNQEIEKVKCRRFGIRINDPIRMSYANPNVMYFEPFIGHKLRLSSPTIDVYSFTVYGGVAPLSPQTGFTVDSITVHENVLTIRMAKTAHGLTDGLLQIDAFISAEM